jgi:hypothetical protein
MRHASLKCALALSCLLAVSATAATDGWGTKRPHADRNHIIYLPPLGSKRPVTKAGPNLVYNGGPVIISAHVVFIFWGPSFANGASPDHGYATTLQAFRNQLGTAREYNVITQYCAYNGCVARSNLGAGTPDWFDTSTPPTNVTDALVRSEVNSYVARYGFDANAIYEVVIPSSSYSSSGSGTSCGGPNLSYCAYHSWIGGGTSAVKYSIQPYPSCGGCQSFGWTATQNQEDFVTHETRETVTDPEGGGWYEGFFNEADDKCAWSPAPFFGTGGYGYQYEWSNAVAGCVTATDPFVNGVLSVAGKVGCSPDGGCEAGTIQVQFNTTPVTIFYDGTGVNGPGDARGIATAIAAAFNSASPPVTASIAQGRQLTAGQGEEWLVFLSTPTWSPSGTFTSSVSPIQSFQETTLTVTPILGGI